MPEPGHEDLKSEIILQGMQLRRREIYEAPETPRKGFWKYNSEVLRLNTKQLAIKGRGPPDSALEIRKFVRAVICLNPDLMRPSSPFSQC